VGSWVTELADVDGHADPRSGRDTRQRVGYSAPIVDHGEERREALRRWERIR
jgi:deoxyribodipyrimidine photo-lyase